VDIYKSGLSGRRAMIVFKDQIWIKNASGFWKKIKFLRFSQNRRSEILLPAGPLEGMGLFVYCKIKIQKSAKQKCR
jgi:hypothetical protein